ncbi:AEC family transporter [Sphingobium yanoikuyae]|uniref:AEC family transporter n=1 Tax=Sphingobium yanoikuyae TaxID=13690 RepID=A0A6M4G8K0_SPHYA|nr:AEC family transporter [Sphingobium yanoikuyae]QJR03518.1 AEC family transporter [Sphingobium yanoikuyae]
MLSVLLIVLPIFALIGAGWIARRSGVLGPHATGEINRFVVWLALPALLFDIVAKARWSDIWQPGFIAVFGIGAGLSFAATLLLRRRGGRHLADATVDGLNAGYANTGFIGFPLAATILGPASLAPTLVATIITVCVLFAVALILIEIGVQSERRPGHMMAKVGRSLATNPLLVAPLVGGLFLAFAIPLPAPLDKFLSLLGGAASPCALVALGLFIAEKREGAPPPAGAVGFLVGMKLLAQPLLTGALALIFRLPPALAATAVLMAALPTGTGPFMVAEFYGREAGITARVVLVSTIASLVTITLYLSLR